jgi:hypothetical protein
VPQGKVAIEGKLERLNGEQMFTMLGRRVGTDANLHFEQSGLQYELRVLNSIEAERGVAGARANRYQVSKEKSARV